MFKAGCDFLSFEADSYVEDLQKKTFFLSKNTKKLVQSLEVYGFIKPEDEEKNEKDQKNIDLYDKSSYDSSNNKNNKNKQNNINNNINNIINNSSYHNNNSIINNHGFNNNNNGYLSNGGLGWSNINSSNSNNNYNDIVPKISNKRWSNLSIRIIYPKDCMLSIGVERLFSFNVKTDYMMFYHKLDDRRPDFTQIFLNKFKVYDLINENPFSVVLTFFGLPKSYSITGDISFNVLINANSTHKSLKQSNSTNARPPTYLVTGSKKKRAFEEDPIPPPIYEEGLNFDDNPTFPVHLFTRENPFAYGKCRDLDGGHRSCDKDSKCIKDRYNLLNLHDFGVEVKKLDGTKFPKQGTGEISFKTDMTYYFMHYFSDE
ncbi:hypothetical protein RB653_008629 [Dictyostelium firmibasis]|uniref:Uncharacterized protein n=1 Tax=Dictyostelium firmibasis TaxID=79012 RepID=A0AAN7TT26_9MYCE